MSTTVYTKGVWGAFGPGDVITPELEANLGIVGVGISVPWREVESADGVYDFTPLTDKIADAKAHGFNHIVAIVTWSQTETPSWLKNELEADGQTLLLRDPGHEGTTYCKELLIPIYWSPRWHAKRLALIAALGPILDPDPAIVATFCSFLNHRTMDWNTLDAQQLLDGCPAGTCPGGVGPCDIYVDQPKQWNDAGWTRALVEGIGQEIIAACAAAFPHKCLKLPIGGMHDELAQFTRTVTNTSGTPNIQMPSGEFLVGDVGDEVTGRTVDNVPCFPANTTILSRTDASNVVLSNNTTGDCTKISLPFRNPDPRGDVEGNYTTIAFEIVEWVKTQSFADRVYLSRNTASATWDLPPTTPPNLGGENYIKYMIAQAVPLSGLQTVTSASQCIEDCSTSCRLFGSDPVCPPTDTLETVMQAALDAMVAFGPPTLPEEITFIEAWAGDAKNPRFYEMTIDATLRMGGQLRNSTPMTETFATSAIGTPLKWDIHAPKIATFPPPWDVVCLFHGGGWARGTRQQIGSVGKDLANAGILALACDYELTTVLLDGQSDPVIWPDQHIDCALAIAAARNPDPTSAIFGYTTGKVGALGGSAGATLAMDCGLIGTAGANRADCVCALSANYDFSDQDSLDQYEGQSGWLDDIYLYNNVADRSFVTELYNQSVLPLVTDPATIPPLYMVQSEADAVGPPGSQMAQMVAALNTVGFTAYTDVLVHGQGHAQANWYVPNPNTGNLVSLDVINFFKAAFLGGGGPPIIPTKGFRMTLTGGPYTIVGAFTGGILPEEARTASIADLAPGTTYSATLVHFDGDIDSEPAYASFTSDAATGVLKSIPFGAYHLLGASGGDFWTGIGSTTTLGFNYVKGYRGRTGIANIVPGTLGVYDFSGPDSAVTVIAASSKKLGMSVAVGVDATAQWYDTGGANEVAKIAVDLADINPQAYQPVPWDPAHLVKMSALVSALGAKYDSNTTVSYFVVGGFMQSNEAYLSKTAADDLQWDTAADDFGYTDKVQAYMAAAQAIIGYYITAFPNTPLYFTSAKVFKGTDGTTAQNQIEAWIQNSTNHKCGVMVASQKAAEPPHAPPVMATFPKGAQAISASTDHGRFYTVQPSPYPSVPQPVDDLMANTASVGRTFIEMYNADITDAANSGVITANNAIMQSIVPTL